MDIFEKCYAFQDAREAIARGVYPYFIPMTENEGSETVFHGRRLIMCGSNNYLGLTTHPKVREAAIRAVERFGTSCTGSRFLNGTLELHEQLEHELAEWVGKEAALVFSTGMQTNLGTVSALVGRGDVVILDKDDHASIVDGARLGYGKLERFIHNDMNHLERVLQSIPDTVGRLIVVDGLFSMEGDLADLPNIVPLAKKYGARIMVDDAHGMGVLGGGKGTAAHFGLTNDVDLIMSTFSKSFASLGGFIAGDDDVVHYIKHHARALIFSASIPAGNAAAALAALQVMREEPERIFRVNQIAEKMRAGFRSLGFDIGHSVTPVIPIIIGDDERTFLFWRALFDAGVFVNPVISPAVPPGRQLLRTSYMATHTDEQLDRVLEIFSVVGKQLGVIS
ncbi:MAG TPA: aminotransferase class I/II-fold pyridoxal phosphate-dependent enzyme [Anaerolineaceae bacterium]|jgi:8-amino-7-oxononanoate synthase|nr:aminotransferase class I/II-fold pyridoxal phosphate-dependent enzyme [Longilinea sp.]NMD31942.1 aminotransferase class I/II-fold pyridoxal phosphate-dependent enzyme [Chloroflexota bacterium]HNZ00952.1 aminotransferase class I/II-fold pyridoxal phosphate-dependent enzyme [Anaerolineaceae bacterium]HOD45485.1 aminotransferase class I/II-fold pyridoxal phosphate-dependent enzyme [Anaerolineaceae bacterium]HOH19403.1 aminotransferase class I/II-fold pyridoxal phosphate-dependent enzyme [Anaero